MMEQELRGCGRLQAGAQEQIRGGRRFVPEADICETEAALWLAVDLPGVDAESLDICFEEGELSIEGRVASRDDEELTPLYTECHVGPFFRRFRIEPAIDADRIRARLKQGVLELELPKAERPRPRRIPVKGS